MLRFIFVCICVFFTVAPWTIEAMTPEQKQKIHEHFEEIGMACMNEFPITEDDITKLRGKAVPAGENAPCFLSCMMRKMGSMDDQGMLQKETALELAKKVFDDPEEVKNLGDFLHSCISVNEAAVSDGSKGCERALLGYKCMLENSSKFGFEM